MTVTVCQGHYFNDYCNWQHIHQFKDFVFNSPAAELAARFMESSYSVFYHEHVLNKEPGRIIITKVSPLRPVPGTEKETPWHHDQAYYPIDGARMLSIWMPVDPVSLDCSVKFVRGSHRWGKWFHPRKFASEMNYPVEREEATDGKTFHDVPVQDIESGKYEAGFK